MVDILNNDITVITGPMKCGKTKLLIELYNQYKHNYKCGIFKPQMDNRFSECEVVDRDGNRAMSTNFKTLHELKKYTSVYDIYFIDEFQFITGDVNIINELIDINKKFIICGLNLTSDRKPFGNMDKIMCCADSVILKTGNCDICGRPSKYSFCEKDKKDDVLIGDSQYKSVCKECYIKLKR